MPQDKVVTFPLNGLDRPSAAPQPQPTQPSRFADGRAFGEFLRQQREARRVSVREIASRTKILASRLEALERGDVRSWPTGIYRRALIRDYAVAIGLDSADIVQEFLALFPAPDPAVVREPAPRPRGVFVRDTLRHLAQAGTRLRSSWRSGVSVQRIVPKRRAFEVLGSTVLGAVLGASAAWMVMDLEPGRETAAQPGEAAAHMTTGSIHVAQLAVDTPLATAGAAANSRFDDPLSAAPPAGVAPAAANADHVDGVARPAVQHAVDTTAGAGGSIEGRLRVTSNVPGARVTVNGIGWGSTPVTIRYLPPGPKRIRVTKDGYRSVERTVELTPDQSDVAVRLELRPL
jgi:hypothetical protein